MTNHVRMTYRRHRGRTWALAALAVVVVAAIAIPVASGASDKTYTLVFPSPATTPAAKTSSPTNQTLCVGTAYDVTLKLSNTAKTVSLGSADITFPASVTDVSVVSLTSASAGYTVPAAAQPPTVSGRKVSLRQLSMPKGKALNLKVHLTASASPKSEDADIRFSASVKQSNDFNDTGGGANTFEPAPMPTITVETCVVDVGGNVYLDKAADGDFDPATTNPPSSGDLTLSGWTVSLYRTSAPAGPVTPATGSVTTTGANGTYLFKDVPTGKDYKVCANPPSGTWSQTRPPANTVCQGQTPSNPWGIEITPLAGEKTSPDMDFASLAVTNLPDTACENPFEGTTLNSGLRYRAQFVPNGTSCKTGDVVMYSYKNGGEFVTALNPTPTGHGTYQVVEYIRWDGFPSEQNPVKLRYDDIQPYDGVDDPNTAVNDGYRVMQMCTDDPRGGKDDLPVSESSTDLELPAGDYGALLPTGETTCMLRSLVSATDDGVTYEAWTFSSLDGARAGP